ETDFVLGGDGTGHGTEDYKGPFRSDRPPRALLHLELRRRQCRAVAHRRGSNNASGRTSPVRISVYSSSQRSRPSTRNATSAEIQAPPTGCYFLKPMSPVRFVSRL